MAYSAADLASLESAIVTLATREAARAEIDGRVVEYRRSDLPHMERLRATMQGDISSASRSTGSLCWIKPVGRT